MKIYNNDINDPLHLDLSIKYYDVLNIKKNETQTWIHNKIYNMHSQNRGEIG